MTPISFKSGTINVMSSSINLSFKTLISHSTLKCTSRRRRFCRATAASPPPPPLRLHFQKLGRSVLLPNVVVLESHFTPPGSNSPDLDHCPRLATGFFLTPTLIATSALAVAHAITNEAHIARTLAFTPHGVMLPTIPLAVSFALGVAVIEVASHAPRSASAEGLAVAESRPRKDSIVISAAVDHGQGFGMILGNVRCGGAAAERSVTAEAPWPLDDGLGWIEHGWFGVGVGDPGSDVALSEASMTRISGSPWLNEEGKVVGVSSWEVKDKAAQYWVGLAAPASSIRAVVDYAKTKADHHPLVMDTWIHAHLFYGS